LQMFLTVFRSNSDQNLTEVPITPETLCRDVVEFCKQPGEGGCYLAEAWRSSGEARPAQNLAGGGEQPTSRHLSVLLLPNRTDGRREGANDGGAAAVGGSTGWRAAGLVVSRTPAENTVGVVAGAVSLEAKASANPEVPCVPGAGGPTPGLPERLRDLAAWQQQRISSQQQLLASKVQQPRRPHAPPACAGLSTSACCRSSSSGAWRCGSSRSCRSRSTAAAAGERPQPGGQAAAGASAAGSGGAQTAQQRQTGSVCQETAPERWRRAPAPTQMSPSVPRGGGPADEPAPPAEAAGAPAGRLPGGAAQPAAGGSEEQQAGVRPRPAAASWSVSTGSRRSALPRAGCRKHASG
ncbi:unnamed protein product, partial [Tetraodon nigroviridis]